METIHSYRHIIDSETAKLFENALKETIKKSPPKKLGFIGLILDYNKKEHHDLDVLIFPSKEAKIGEAIIELTELYAKIEKKLKEKNERYYLATSARKITQELTYYLAGLEEGTASLIPIHSLFFPDYKSFKKFNPSNFEKEIKKSLITIHGKFDIIKEVKNDIPQEKLEPYFVILDFELNARIKTFPRHNIRASAESLFTYLKDKYGIKVKEKIHNIDEIENEFKILMKKLDEITYS